MGHNEARSYAIEGLWCHESDMLQLMCAADGESG